MRRFPGAHKGHRPMPVSTGRPTNCYGLQCDRPDCQNCNTKKANRKLLDQAERLVRRIRQDARLFGDDAVKISRVLTKAKARMMRRRELNVWRTREELAAQERRDDADNRYMM